MDKIPVNNKANKHIKHIQHAWGYGNLNEDHKAIYYIVSTGNIFKF